MHPSSRRRPATAPEPRRHRPGTAGRGLRLLLASTLAGLMAMSGALPSALAYTPGTFPAALGSPDGPRPTVAMTVTTNDADGLVNPGQAINYIVTATLAAPLPGPNSQGSPGTSNILEYYLDVTPSPDAPLNGTPTASDFTWSDGVTRPFSQAPTFQNGVWSFHFLDTSGGMGAALTVTATLPATVSATATPGTTLTTTATGNDTIFPRSSWTSTNSHVDGPLDATGACTGVATYTTTLDYGPYGGWLADIHLGSATPGLVYDSTAPQVVVTDANGNDITAQVTQDMTFNPNDPTRPFDPAADVAGVTWSQSLNWPFDTNTSTGSTWVLSGTTITVRQGYTDPNCSATVETHGSTTSGDLPRPGQGTATASVTVAALPAPAWAVRKTTSDAPLVLAGTTATTVTRTYGIVLTNTGDAAGTAPAVVDTPAVPAGMTIQSAIVDGAAATVAPDGTITIPGTGTIAAGASANHTVVVTYAVNPTTLTAAQWTALASCTTSAGQATSGPGAGLYNSVALPAGVTDTDGPANNDVCTNATGAPAIQVVKRINGDDADAAPGVGVVAGSAMRITYAVTNTGNQPLTRVTVTDAVTAGGTAAPTDIDCDPATPGAQATIPGTLAPGAPAVVCTATMTAPAAGVQHTDLARVAGTPPANPDGTLPPAVTDTNPANALPVAPPVPRISIRKSINGQDANTAPGVVVEAGSTMAVTVDVTNTGTVPLVDVTVTDAAVSGGTAAALDCDPATPGDQSVVPGTLAPGGTARCTASVPAPAPGVQHTDVATVVGTPPRNPDGSTPPRVRDDDPANAVVPAPPSPSPAPAVAIADTGSEVSPAVLATGGSMVAAGAVLLLAGRRRRDRD